MHAQNRDGKIDEQWSGNTIALWAATPVNFLGGGGVCRLINGRSLFKRNFE